jgi:hypothetical protein
MRIAFGVLIAGLASTPAAAQQVALVEMPRVGERSVRFLDVGGLKRTGIDVEVRMLSATARPEGEAAPVVGSLLTYRISCEWQADVATEARDIDINGEVTETRAFQRVMSFFAPKGPEADISAMVCDPNVGERTGALTSLKDAMAEAARTTKRPPARQPRDPSAPIPAIAAPPPPKQELLQNFGGQGPSAYGLVHAENGTGNALFLDWANFRREDDVVQALTFEVLGDDPAKESLGGLMKHSSVEIDCKAKTIRTVGYQTFGRGLKPERGGTADRAWRPVTSGPLRTDLLNAACKGRKPSKTLATMAEAAAFAATRK